MVRLAAWRAAAFFLALRFRPRPLRFRRSEVIVYAGVRMPKNPPTEKTPKGHTVPVPKRDKFYANLKRVAKVPDKGSATDRPQT